MTAEAVTSKGASLPMFEKGRRSTGQQGLVWLFVIAPFIALLAAVPVAWIWGWLSWRDIVIAVCFYTWACLGVTVGYHRYLTHSAFKAKDWLRRVLTFSGMMGFQGGPIPWVADHRRHHIFSDKDGDPHSPWAFGDSAGALAKGFFHAHVGWLFDRDVTNAERFAPDLLEDPIVSRMNGWFGWVTLFNLTAPALIGGLWSWSLWGAVTAFFWGGLVRAAFLHHVTWSTNSVCHMIGERPFVSQDKAGNVWWLAILSMGESWHNAHHTALTWARHGVLRGQLDASARLIWIFEKFGWAWSVRWPTAQQVQRKLVNKPPV